jgi:hypothetical protein
MAGVFLLSAGLRAQVATTTTLTSATPTAPVFGQKISLSATVTPAAATGSVSFMDGGVLVGVGTVIGGIAQMDTLTLPAGPHSLRAVYGGGISGATYLASQSSALPLVVTAVPGAGFVAAASPKTGNNPYSAVIGDFNGDAKADLAVANDASDTVSVLLGNGDGTFTAAAAAATGPNPIVLAVGDFNGDGNADLAVVNNGNNTVSVLLGHRDGTFTAAAIAVTGPDPRSVAVGDFNGDGKADLAVANRFDSTVSILLGRGDGTFTAAARPTTDARPFSVAVGDFDGNGIADLAVANQTGNSVSILLGRGDGTFAAATRVGTGTGTNPLSVAVGDFNGDGKADLAVVNETVGMVSILLGHGDGTFTATFAPSTGVRPQSVAVGDFNGDGKADLTVANNSDNTVSILLGNGDGTFTVAASRGTGNGPQSVTVGDFNGDGRADLAVANFSSDNSVSILLGVSPVSAAVTSSPAGASINVTGTGCAPGSYTTPVNLIWVPAVTCTISFADPQLIAGVNYAFTSSTVNGSATSRTNPLTLSSGATALAIHATYQVVSGTGSGGATHFSVSPSSFTASAGAPVQFTVTALDASNATVTGYSGLVHFTSTDGSATLPADATLTNGVGAFTASLVSLGTQRLVASDLLSPSITGTSGNITVSAPAGLRFVPVTPCRVADTRNNPPGPFSGPFITASTSRLFPVPNSACGIPASAQAYSFNVTVVPHGLLGYITVWPTGQAQPVVSTLNSLDGRVKANAAIVPAGAGGAISIFATNDTDLILDINGYFVPASNPAALAFYPMSPCRLVDTRSNLLSGGALSGGTSRTLPLLSGSCNVPPTARAYSLNFTAVPPGFLGYLSVWPTGQPQPLVSTLNDLTGTVVANAAIVPAGASGSIDVFATNTTDLVVDINGYFAPAGTGGLSLYNLPPCRVLDTRNPPGSPAFTGSEDVNVIGSVCGGTSAAQEYVLNATVVPTGLLGYLTLWPQGTAQPTVSTLNALDGAITNNMAIVPANNTEVSAYASGPGATHLILDISGYFAP